jgi:hypothetical protein
MLPTLPVLLPLLARCINAKCRRNGEKEEEEEDGGREREREREGFFLKGMNDESAMEERGKRMSKDFLLSTPLGLNVAVLAR